MAETVSSIVPETEWPSEAPLQLMQEITWKPEKKVNLGDSEGTLSSAKIHKLEAKGPRSDPKGAVDWIKNVDKGLVPSGAAIREPSTKPKKKTKGPTVTPKMLATKKGGPFTPQCRTPFKLKASTITRKNVCNICGGAPCGDSCSCYAKIRYAPRPPKKRCSSKCTAYASTVIQKSVQKIKNKFGAEMTKLQDREKALTGLLTANAKALMKHSKKQDQFKIELNNRIKVANARWNAFQNQLKARRDEFMKQVNYEQSQLRTDRDYYKQEYNRCKALAKGGKSKKLAFLEVTLDTEDPSPCSKKCRKLMSKAVAREAKRHSKTYAKLYEKSMTEQAAASVLKIAQVTEQWKQSSVLWDNIEERNRMARKIELTIASKEDKENKNFAKIQKKISAFGAKLAVQNKKSQAKAAAMCNGVPKSPKKNGVPKSPKKKRKKKAEVEQLVQEGAKETVGSLLKEIVSTTEGGQPKSNGKNAKAKKKKAKSVTRLTVRTNGRVTSGKRFTGTSIGVDVICAHKLLKPPKGYASCSGAKVVRAPWIPVPKPKVTSAIKKKIQWYRDHPTVARAVAGGSGGGSSGGAHGMHGRKRHKHAYARSISKEVRRVPSAAVMHPKGKPRGIPRGVPHIGKYKGNKKGKKKAKDRKPKSKAKPKPKAKARAKAKKKVLVDDASVKTLVKRAEGGKGNGASATEASVDRLLGKNPHAKKSALAAGMFAGAKVAPKKDDETPEAEFWADQREDDFEAKQERIEAATLGTTPEIVKEQASQAVLLAEIKDGAPSSNLPTDKMPLEALGFLN